MTTKKTKTSGRRLTAWIIILAGILGFVIMFTDSITQAIVGLTLMITAVVVSSQRQYGRVIYRELLRFNKFLGMDDKEKGREKI
jgi:uncharacterized membrane protein YdcZ (DUF606 family)